jgi:acyl-CoA reductase-like NAD-dependent aldehyde dehydrogenase
MKNHKMWIGGKWVDAASGKTFPVINPASQEELGRVPLGGEADVNEAVKAAQKAFPLWSGKQQSERSAVVSRLAAIMRENSEDLIRLEMVEHGSPIGHAHFMVEWSTQLVEFAAHASRTLMGDVLSPMPNMVNYVQREPVGVCALITPWNAPLMMIAAKLAPALAAGNACIVKPPSINSLVGLRFAEMVSQLDLPPGTVNFVTGPGGTVGQALAAHPGIDLIAFTGSTEAGRAIMITAGRTVKRLQMELGGKNPFMVFEDANLEAAVEAAVQCLYHNSGQSCASPGRFYAHEGIYDEFARLFVEKSRQFVVGDPADGKTTIGPMASAEQRDRVEYYIESGIKEGATLLLGGQRPTSPPLDKGFYVSPAVFVNVTQEMKVAREEIFGPVACILKFSSDDEALAKANDSPYGLCASVWTRNTAKGLKLANRLRAGTVWVNQHMKLDDTTPWGGVKQSGMGKESGVYGLAGFTDLKLVCVELAE